MTYVCGNCGHPGSTGSYVVTDPNGVWVWCDKCNMPIKLEKEGSIKKEEVNGHRSDHSVVSGELG